LKRSLIDYLLILVIVAALGVAAVGLFRYVTQPSGYVLTWTTENTLDILGFHVYRADSEDGTYVKITDRPIPPTDDPLADSDYQYVDQSAESGTRYYYKLETIFRDGQSELMEEPIVLPPP
jgi:hypothetical protein